MHPLLENDIKQIYNHIVAQFMFLPKVKHAL
jgi:hypothetical protein